MRLCAAAALLAAAGFSVQSAWAAELGTLSVSSRLNEPLEAKLTINQVTDASQPLVLRLASDAVYAKVGRQPLPADLGVKLTLASRNPWVVSVTSAKPVTEEDMPLIIEMSEAGKLSAKFYRVKLEPAKAAAKTAAQKTAAASSAKTALKLPSAQTAAPAAKAASALPSAEKTSAAAAKPDVKATPVKTAEKPAAATKTAPKAAAQTASDDLYGLGDLSRPVTVKSGMTMWSIAKMYQPRYEGARTEEVLVALVRANPKAFEGGRVTGVKKGARLVPPSEKAVKAVGADTAWCLVHVTPNADARKTPSAAAMAKAHARMDKLGILYDKTPAVKPAAKPVVKAAPAVKPAAEPKIEKAVLPVASPEPAAKPAVEPAASAVEPAPAPAAAPAAAPEPPAPAVKAEEKPAMTVTTTTTNIRDEDIPKKAEEGGHGWLWGLLLAVIAAAGAGFFVWRRRKESARVEEARTVSFLRPEPTTPEQMKGMDTLFANRVAADAAAEKGFGMKTGVTSAPQPAARVQAQPDPMSQTAQAPEAAPAAPAYTPAPTPSAQPLGEPEVEEPRPFTIRSTAEGMQFELEQPDNAQAAQKLEAARAKVSAGLPDEAEPLLKDVVLTGSAEQKAAAERLLDTVKRV